MARFFLAFPVAAGLPPFLFARLCHLSGCISDDFGWLGTAWEYGEDLARCTHGALLA